ncbi:hypothetical protein [Oenococcus kitaharae]|nr:hypothetical protein [Oenococcus kitaharae]OEY84687.1 hypothetical protein NT95_00935 [Oenococcus kitaharae]OEY84971.1 hypothetical protein NT96_02505 [Oenococcus kitaharae]OEY85761.1 hypothetical protein NV75_02810 [Oenococcus kitaharae]
MAGNNYYKVGLVISPGYLSTTSQTADKLAKAIINNQKIAHCWILGTMNGGFLRKKKILNFTLRALSSTPKSATQPRLKTSFGFSRDHRKMFFIVCWRPQSNPTLRNKKDISGFMKDIYVPIATIGSSNFSKSTYFMGNDHNEADILWVDDDVLKKINPGKNMNDKKFNSAIISSDDSQSPNNDFPGIVSAQVYSLPQNSNYLKLILKETLDSVLI